LIDRGKDHRVVDAKRDGRGTLERDALEHLGLC